MPAHIVKPHPETADVTFEKGSIVYRVNGKVVTKEVYEAKIREFNGNTETVQNFVAAAKMVCHYCGGRYPKDVFLNIKERPFRSGDGANFEHACGVFCKAYKIWDYLEVHCGC